MPSPELDQESLEEYRLCIWREASGEGYVGMLAIGWNIHNRSIAWREPILSIVMTPNQYTSMHAKKPRKPEFGDPQFAQACEIVDQVLAGVVPDPTNGGLYYANLNLVRADNVKAGLPPESGWFFEHIVRDTVHHPVAAIIGQHTFFR